MTHEERIKAARIARAGAEPSGYADNPADFALCAIADALIVIADVLATSAVYVKDADRV